jgi:hypothetical protein
MREPQGVWLKGLARGRRRHQNPAYLGTHWERGKPLASLAFLGRVFPAGAGMNQWLNGLLVTGVEKSSVMFRKRLNGAPRLSCTVQTHKRFEGDELGFLSMEGLLQWQPTRISSRRVAKPGIASWQRQTASLRSLPEPGQKRHDLWRLVIISRACRP